jgi:pyruvate,orthophosphate dikinase
LAQVRQKEDILNRVKALSESNPMLGLRGDRLSVVMPEITEMQVRAILEAAIHVKKEGIDVHPEIMVPLAGHVNELKFVKEIVDRVAQKSSPRTAATVDFKYGSMIEMPRAALTADELATVAEFYSFGTNDLTQTTFGMSRDDAESKFLIEYIEQGVLPVNPFQTLDRSGVGKLVKMSVELGRQTRPGDAHGHLRRARRRPQQHRVLPHGRLELRELQPYRVPIARLAAAQAAIKHA